MNNRNRLFTASVLLALIVSASVCYGESSRTLPPLNEYDGTSVLTEFSPGDKYLDEFSIQKTIAQYDKNNNLMQADFYYTAQFGTNKGYSLKSEFYGTDRKAVRGIYYYTPLFSEKKGYSRSIDTYNPKGKVVRQEFEYIEKFAKESGYSNSVAVIFQGFVKQWEYSYIESMAKKIGYWKRIDYYVYDPYGNGKITEQAFFDKDGREIRRGKPETETK